MAKMNAAQVAALPSLTTIARWVGGADQAERFRIVLEFVRAWREEDLAAGERQELLAEEPALSGDPRWDALIAGLAEHLARSSSLKVPPWVVLPQRFLDRPFFPIAHRSVRTAALVSSPAAFRRRGVFLDPESLATV